MKTVGDGLELRRRIFGAFELADMETDPNQRRSWLSFAVVGGGPTGVEIAGQIGELSHRTLKGNFRSIDPSTATIMLFSGGDEILAHFGDRLAEKATAALEKKGVDVYTRSRVTGVDAEGVTVKRPEGERRIAARTVVWAAGVQASPLARRLGEAAGLEVDRSGRVPVEPDCTLAGHPNVFAIGDMMALNQLPGVAEVAMQQGIYVARTIRRRLKGKGPRGPFRYRDFGSLAVIGRGKAVVSIGRMRLSGRLGFVVWLLVHLAFLTGFANRLRAIFSWGYMLVSRSRAERTMTVHNVSTDWSLGEERPAEMPAQPPAQPMIDA